MFNNSILKAHSKIPMSSFRTEAELLLCCAQTCIASKGQDRIKSLLKEDVDWAYLLRIAFQNGMMPLLYWNLSTTYPEAVPKTILNLLRHYVSGIAKHNIYASRELFKLLGRLEAQGILAFPYKGPILSLYTCGNLALRVYGDLDILIRRSDIQRAKRLLISQGYAPMFQLTTVQEIIHIKSQCSYSFINRDTNVCVDLHWGVCAKHFNLPLDFEFLWDKHRSFLMDDRTIHTISTEHLLLILSIHGFKHTWSRLQWICDISEIIQADQEIDWDGIIKQAEALGCKRMLFLGLLLANELLGTPLPNNVHSLIHAEGKIGALIVPVCECLFNETQIPPAVIEFDQVCFHVDLLEGWQSKVRYILHVVHRRMTPNQKDWEQLSLPRFLFFLYYLLRPFRLLSIYGLSLLKHLCSARRLKNKNCNTWR